MNKHIVMLVIIILMVTVFISFKDNKQEVLEMPATDMLTTTSTNNTSPGNYDNKFGLTQDRTFGFVPVEVDLDLASEKGLTTSDGQNVNDDYLFVADIYRRGMNIILDSAGVGDFDVQIKSDEISLATFPHVNIRSNYGGFTDVKWSCFYLANFCNIERLSAEQIDLILSFKNSETDVIPDTVLPIVQNTYPDVLKVYAKFDDSSPIGYGNGGEYTFENQSLVLVINGLENYAVGTEEKQLRLTKIENALTNELDIPVKIMIKSI